MSNYRKDQLQELSMNIIKDSKRRVVYYHPIRKEGYLLGPKDRGWVLVLHLRYIIAVLVGLTLTNFIPQYLLLWVGVAIIIFFAIQILFDRLFLANKIPLKVAQKDIDQMYDAAVLKHKRTFVFYYMLLSAIVLFFIITLVLGTEEPFDLITKVVSIGLSAVVFILQFLDWHAVNNQYKLAKKSE